MWARRFYVLLATIGFTLISADSRLESNVNPIGISLATRSAVADEVGKTTSAPSMSFDVEQNCDLGSTKLNQLDASTREQICSELTHMREILRRLQVRITSFREASIANDNRCHKMELLATKSTVRVRELVQELMRLDKEREQLKYLLRYFNLISLD
jgi:hypothetical protein